MARSQAKCLGEGAKCSILLKRLHPQNIIREVAPVYNTNERLSDCTVIKQETTKRNGKSFMAVYVSHPHFEGRVLYSAKKWAVVTEEGDRNKLFDAAPSAAPADDIAKDGVPIDPSIFRLGNHAEDIAIARNQGFHVDDDNDPAPENIPQADDTVETDTGLFPTQRWGVHSHVDPMVNDGFKQPPGFRDGFYIKNASLLDIFCLFFPITWLKTVLIPQTNLNLTSAITFGELLRFIGIRLKIASIGGGFKVDDFWSAADFDEDNNPCPYNFRNKMSRSRFRAITAALSFTDRPKPAFVDKFWEVRQIVAKWNRNMAKIFIVGWVLCLDESMSIWHNRYTCPGWVFCPRKPHPFGNEYHSACCGITGIMFVIEMVEGKDRPPDLGPALFEELGKTAGLLLRMLQSIFNTGRYVVLDSGFCVLAAVCALFKKGVYAGALIKKRRYWPKYVPGDAIDARFDSLGVGMTDAVSGTLDGVDYSLFCMKEPEYVMKLMATGGVLESDDLCRETFRGMGNDRISFRYSKPIDWHFRYRHAVDNHNNLRHSLPSLEDSWVTQRWEIRVFTFLLAITEVNIYLAMRYFVWTSDEAMTLVAFRRMLSNALINNHWLPGGYGDEGGGDDGLDTKCDVISAPPFAREYRNRAWDCSAPIRNTQYVCKAPGCKKRVRTCCACMLGHWMCPTHIVRHAVNKASESI